MFLSTLKVNLIKDLNYNRYVFFTEPSVNSNGLENYTSGWILKKSNVNFKFSYPTYHILIGLAVEVFFGLATSDGLHNSHAYYSRCFSVGMF